MYLLIDENGSHDTPVSGNEIKGLAEEMTLKELNGSMIELN